MDEKIDEIPDDILGRVAPHVNLLIRQAGGFMDGEGVRDILRLVSMHTRRWSREQAYKANRQIIEDQIG